MPELYQIMSDRDHRSVFIITGDTGSGKTTFLLKLIENLKAKGLSSGGFAALSVPGDGPSGSYNLLDLVSGKILPLASRRFTQGWEALGGFYFNPEGIRTGINILEDPQIANNDLVVVDEIGPFELEGRIWADSLTRLLTGQPFTVLMVIREKLVARAVQKWGLQHAVIIDIRRLNPEQAAVLISSELAETEG